MSTAKLDGKPLYWEDGTETRWTPIIGLWLLWLHLRRRGFLPYSAQLEQWVWALNNRLFPHERKGCEW